MRQEIDDMFKTWLDQPNEPVAALIVFGTHANYNKHNEKLVNPECDAVFEISATDLQKDASGKLKKLPKHKKGHTSAMPDVLKVGLNARVMLMRNLDVSNGLVNGVLEELISSRKLMIIS